MWLLLLLRWSLLWMMMHVWMIHVVVISYVHCQIERRRSKMLPRCHHHDVCHVDYYYDHPSVSYYYCYLSFVSYPSFDLVYYPCDGASFYPCDDDYDPCDVSCAFFDPFVIYSGCGFDFLMCCYSLWSHHYFYFGYYCSFYYGVVSYHSYCDASSFYYHDDGDHLDFYFLIDYFSYYYAIHHYPNQQPPIDACAASPLDDSFPVLCLRGAAAGCLRRRLPW
mmetsp:Transcript_8472/g.12814  ORF Transcript_8472/g.12814 Transcript_8472/m.12814 type:complete len:221 (+) Transcript_8472:280-942(+)